MENTAIGFKALTKTHHLKIKYEFAQLHFQGKKDWEIRQNDRNYKEGDNIIFTVVEFGFMYTCKITNVFNEPNYGLKDGYVILSIETVMINK